MNFTKHGAYKINSFCSDIWRVLHNSYSIWKKIGKKPTSSEVVTHVVWHISILYKCIVYYNSETMKSAASTGNYSVMFIECFIICYHAVSIEVGLFIASLILSPCDLLTLGLYLIKQTYNCAYLYNTVVVYVDLPVWT